MRIVAFILAIFPLCCLAAQPQQSFVSLEIMKDGVVVNSDGLVATDTRGFYTVGTQNGYPSVVCSNNAATLRSVSVFAGLTVTHRLTENGVDLEINRYAVDPPTLFSEDAAECRPVAPKQRVLLAAKFVIPLGASSSQIPLENGYSV